jgi:hypothetical protein
MTVSDDLPAESGLELASIPGYAKALLHVLNFANRDGNGLRHLSDCEWRQLLHFCDESQLTLVLGELARPFLPIWVKARIQRNAAGNALRFERIKAATLEIVRWLTANSIEFALVKGHTHAPAFTPDPLLRAQNDIDIWCLPEEVFRARDVLTQHGYRHFGKSKGRHLDPLIRESSWTWAGDYFAPDLPIPVELHYQLWDSKFECIAGPNECELWKRRTETLLDEYTVTTLDLADTLAFAALHLMMHLFHGDLRLQRAWEIGYFLEHHAGDDAFWNRWRSLYSAELRQMQVVAFLLARYWFDCRFPDPICAEVDSLPQNVRAWIRRYAFSPVESLFSPNKDELWLNVALVPSLGGKLKVAARRLLPVHAASDGHAEQTTAGSFTARARYHLRSLPRTLSSGFRLLRARKLPTSLPKSS